MSDVAEATVEETASAFMGLLDAEDGTAEPEPKRKPARAASEEDAPDAEAASDDEQDSGEGDDPEPGDDEEGDEPAEDDESEPPIEAPASWSKDAKATFASLPRAAQQVIAERERERDVEIRRGQNEVAETRKAVEAERQATVTERAQYARSLETVNARLQALEPKGIDWDKLAQDDPIGYVQALQTESKRQAELQAVKAEQQRVWEQQQRDQEARHTALLAEQRAKLHEAMPAWKDPERAKSDRAALVGFLQGHGYSQDEIALAADHRMVVIAMKALAYEKLQRERPTKQAVTEKKVTTAAPVLKPGTPTNRQSRSDERAKALLNQVKKTGRYQDAAKVFETML